MTVTNPEAETAEDLKAFFEQQRWLLRLAERLVRDHPAAMDLVQETFLAAIKNPPPDATRPQAWLSAVAHRIHRKQQARLSPVYVEDFDDLEYGNGPLPEEAATRRESISKLHEAVQNLKPLKLKAVLLTYQKDLCQAEVAKQLKVSTRTVRNRLKASHREIRRSLAGSQWTRSEAWVLPLLPILDPKTLRREVEPATGGTGLGVLATIGGVAAIGVALVGAMYMLDGSDVDPITVLGAQDLKVARAEERLSDPVSGSERQGVHLEGPEDPSSTDLAPIEPRPDIQPAPPDPGTQEFFWVSFRLRPEGELQNGLFAGLLTEGFMPQGPAPPECKMPLNNDGSARVGVYEQGQYRLIIRATGVPIPGAVGYYTLLQLAHRGQDLEINLDLPATRRVTVKTSEEKIWLYTTTPEGWSIEGVCQVVDGKAVFEKVPVGEIQVRLSQYDPNSNENQPPVKTIRVELDGKNIFEIE